MGSRLHEAVELAVEKVEVVCLLLDLARGRVRVRVRARARVR